MAKRFYIDGRSEQYERDALPTFGSGGEGTVYVLSDQSLAKIYHDEELNRRRQEKVLALCGRRNHFAGVLGSSTFAWPEAPAMSTDDNEVVGFSMSHMGAYPRIDQVGYDLDEKRYRRAPSGDRLDDASAVALAYSLFEALERLHTSRIVLGDLNPDNILADCQSARAKIVDIDSCHLEDFACTVFTPDYLDPLTESAGKRADGSLTYSSASDYYAAVVVTYVLLVGLMPFFMRCENPMSVSESKAKGACLLAHSEDANWLSSLDVRLRSHPDHDAALERLAEIKRLDGGRLHAYWHDVLVKGRRYSLLERLPVTDPRNPEHRLLAARGSRTIVDVIREGMPSDGPGLPTPAFFAEEDVQTIVGLTRRTSRLRNTVEAADPIGFQLFVQNLGFDYRDLLDRGTDAGV